MPTSTSRLMDLVPGGCHTYSKGPDQFPSNAPSAIVKGEGARVLGNDGRWYIDWGMGLTAVSVGHGHRGICDAVYRAILEGTNFIRPSVLEEEAAARFLEVFGGDMVKFCKNGSVATTSAVKLARGFTGRQKVVVPFEHPFFSYDDWFIGASPANHGIPESHRALTLKFRYNDLASLEALFAEHGGDIAAVMLEPVKVDAPVPGFLQGVKDLCRKHGAIFILDETIAGLKWAIRGGQEYFGIEPDLSIWGKGIANGFSACALSGKREIMQIGGSLPTGPKLFLVSTTHGAESGGLAAMLATMDIFLGGDVIGDNWRRGGSLIERMRASIDARGLGDHFEIKGYPCYFVFTTRGLADARALEWKTLIMQEMARHGVLSQTVLFPTPSHDQAVLDETATAFDRALDVVAGAWPSGTAVPLLEGPAIRPVFRSFEECVKGRCGRLHADEPKEPCCR